MGTDNEEAGQAPDELIFRAVITPHRSLSPRGFGLLMAAIGGTSFLAGLVFFAMGAWPIVGFLGLDVALVYYAFRANYRAAQASETIMVTERQLIVRRVSARGVRAEWTLNPYWTRLSLKRDADGDVERMALVSRGERVGVAEWLSPQERKSFAQAIGAALSEARRAPV